MKNKTVLVTGADGDIGRAVCTELTSKGYVVIAIDIRFRDLHWSSSLIQTFEIDLADSTAVDKFFSTLKMKNQKLVGVVNNAGIYLIKRFYEYDMQDWTEVLDINLKVPFLITKLAEPLLKDNSSVVNVSSTGAHLGSRDPGYSSSKAGLLGLTKSCARSLSGRGIRVNAVAPGMIDTQMSRKMADVDKQKNIENALLKRAGKPQEVAKVICFLISEDSSYITGTTIDVNGGLYIR